MKTFKYKIAGFSPDGIFLWSKEDSLEANDRVIAIKLIHDSHKKAGYIAGVDYQFIYIIEVKDAD
jgi:hypothetical protein